MADDAIQAALQAVGVQSAQPQGSSQDDGDIRKALDAISKPVRVVTPDKGPADFLSGGYEHPVLTRAVGGALGALGTASQGAMFLPSGLAYLAGLPFGTDTAAKAQAATLNLLNPTTDWSGQPIAPKGEFSQALNIPQRGLNYALDKAVQGAGGAGAAASDVSTKPLSIAQQARREAVGRTGGEAAIQAALALLGVRGGLKGATKLNVEHPEKTVEKQMDDIETQAPPPEPVAKPQPTDFGQRLAEAAPKPITPETPAPARVQADIAALEAPYRYTEADAQVTLPTLPKWLQGARPKMGEQKLEFASDLDKAAYVVANPRTRSSAHADYLEWLSKSLGTDENTALMLAKRSKEATVASVKAGQPKIQPYLRPKQGEAVVPPRPDVHTPPETQVRITDDPMKALDKALEGTSLVRTPVTPAQRAGFAQENHLRMGQGQGEPLPYVQLVRDAFPTPADEVINAIGEKVFQLGKGDPTRVHLHPDDLKALKMALEQRGWPIHRRDILEQLSAAVDYAMQNRQLRNEGYAPMRAAIQDHNLMGDVLRNPEHYAVTARLREFKPPKDFEKVCTP